jgi:hypothetical protein
MKKLKSLLFIILVYVITASLELPLFAVSDKTLQDALIDTAKYLYSTQKTPEVGSIGGDWVIFGLARSGYTVPEKFYQDYFNVVEKYVKDSKGNLSTTKYTEYSRLILTLSAIGIDPRNIAGYDLTKPLGDFKNTIKQGSNGAAYALIVLDSAGYPMPKNESALVQATRQMYVDHLLDKQLPDGGWNLTDNDGASADYDITAIVLQALSKYNSQPEVKKAVDKALDFLSGRQKTDGSIGSTAESSAQIVIALCELGVPLDDSRFVKNNKTIIDGLMTYYREGKGFLHTSDSKSANRMATEQGFMALSAAVRFMNGQNSLYDLDDPIRIEFGSGRIRGSGLEDKSPDVVYVPVINPSVTFSDITATQNSAAHKNKTAIEALAERGILNGKNSSLFYPNDAMTRAEFSAVIVRALGLPLVPTSAFSDVAPDAWYNGYVGSAYRYGIVAGIGGGLFNPDGLISKQEAAVMVTRAAKLCGMDTSLTASAVRDILAQFGDYIKSSDWARSALAFCYISDFLDESELNIEPERKILRCEVAEMVYRLLGASNLL